MSDYSVRMLSIDNKSLTTNLDRAGYRKMGVHVSSADSFHMAMEILQERDIDVVVINHDYKEVDAFGIVKHIKSDERFENMGTIVTSVQTSASIKKKALAAGADLFVEQPIPRQYFIEKIKTLLEQQTRNTERVEIHGNVEFNWEKKDLSFPINDLSISGMLISMDLSLPDNSTIEMNFTLPSYKKPLKITGEIARTITFDPKNPDRLTGVGVKFTKFQGDSQKRLEKYIETSSEKNSRMQYYL